jgi:hypothetical protein
MASLRRRPSALTAHRRGYLESRLLQLYRAIHQLPVKIPSRFYQYPGAPLQN